MPPKLNQLSGMPQMSAAFDGWFVPITIDKVTQTVTAGLVTNNLAPVTFQGVIQPLSPRSLYLKPEGQRAFTWLQIHAIAGSLNLTSNDRIQYNGKFYKVMNSLDYSLNNYIEYHVIEDPNP